MSEEKTIVQKIREASNVYQYKQPSEVEYSAQDFRAGAEFVLKLLFEGTPDPIRFVEDSKKVQELLKERFGEGNPVKHIMAVYSNADLHEILLKQRDEAISLLEELAMRTQVMFPCNPQQIKQWEQGLKGQHDFNLRLTEWFTRRYPDDHVDPTSPYTKQ